MARTLTLSVSGTIDEVGPWTEVKVQIVREYATVFQKIVKENPRFRFRSVYMDGFAGGGLLQSDSGDELAGTAAQVVKSSPRSMSITSSN